MQRSLVRFWRRLRRPTLIRLLWASLAVHLVAGIALLAWLPRQPWQAPLLPTPLVVELSPAEPGPPLVKPEAPPSRRAVERPAAPARPTPVPKAPPPSVAKPPEPTAPAPVPAPVSPPPPPVPPGGARAPELPPPAPEPAPAPPVAPPTPTPPEPSPPVVSARPPEAPRAPAPAQPAPPAPPAPSVEPREFPLASRQFSLLGPRLDLPPAYRETPSQSGSGGTQEEGAGSGSFGYERDGQAGVPLSTPDPRYAEYFAQIKRRIEAHWVYPQEAARRGQSGQGLVGFVLRKNGSVREVDIVQSSGIEILDRYLVNAINLASPMPPIPDRIGHTTLPVVFAFTYTLQHGIRVFGFQ